MVESGVDGGGRDMRSSPKRASKYLSADKLHEGKGCTCRRSKCLKKYCVCFEAGVECTVGRCKCVDCQNPNGSISKVALDEGVPVVRTKENTRCSCSKTACLKLYCECFRQDLTCGEDCACIGCKNTDEESGPNGERTRAKERILKDRPLIFRTPKKRKGGGCSCSKNKCITKYCDCNASGVGCDPAICSCVNCHNMMKPLSEMPDQAEVEEETMVFALVKPDPKVKVKGLQDFSHLIDDFDTEQRVENAGDKLTHAYVMKLPVVAETTNIITKEEAVRKDLEEQIKVLEARLGSEIAKESAALEDCRKATNKVMCLEMAEPCRWNDTYKKLNEYVMETGDLPPLPSACTSERDRKLAIWVQEMKSLVYSKSEKIMNFPHRIEALESIGVEWIESAEERWNKMYDRLVEYKHKNNTLQLPTFMQCRKAKDKELAALRRWVDMQFKEAKSGGMADRRDRLKKLKALGLPLELTWKEQWSYFTHELLKFRANFGHLYVFGNADPDLVEFVEEVMARFTRSKKSNAGEVLTKDEVQDLKAKGLLPGLVLAAGPAGKGGDHTDGMSAIPLSRVKEVNQWAGMLKQLKAYKSLYGSLDFQGEYQRGKPGGKLYSHLWQWVQSQRAHYANKTLEQSRIKELQKIGFEFDPWDFQYKKLKKYQKEAGTARLPMEWKYQNEDDEKDEELEGLCRWTQQQLQLYRKDRLEQDKKKKLRKLGVVLMKEKIGTVLWEDRFEEMIEYYHANKTCLPRRDGPLRRWVLELVDTIQGGYVSTKRQKIIDESKIAPKLEPAVIFAEPKKKRKASASSGDNKKAKVL